MASLASIWDSPAESASSDPKNASIQLDNDDENDILTGNPKRSTARPRSTLFLESGSEDEAPTSSTAHYASKPSSSKPDIDAFWDDLDADPDTAFQELAPSLDVAELKRKADAKVAALTPHQILSSSSPTRDMSDGEGDEEKGKKAGTKKKDGLVRKKKRAILDEGRLLGRDGFPALVKQAKDFKPKGKGHELSDLSRLLNVYHFWSHKMYPNTQFTDTVQRVEKLCHSKRMHVALGVWRDEAKGLINGHKVPSAHDSGQSDSDDDDKAAAAHPTDGPVATEDERSSPAPSRGPSVPPSSASEAGGLDDDFDIDAMIREEEATRARAASSSTSAFNAPPVPAASSSTPMDEDEAMWDAMVDDVPYEPVTLPQRQPSSPTTSKPAVRAVSVDEDEDMWDIVREMETEEEEGARAKVSGPSSMEPAADDAAQSQSAAPVGSIGLVGVDPTRPATIDEGWDEMYA